MLLKKNNVARRKSYGLEITRERLQMMNLMEKSDQKFEIKDLVDSDGAPLGTCVEIWLKIRIDEGNNT